ncbi:MAG: hypothetical protein ACHQQR_05270 [Gemmatimonadales bacterium]
MNTTAPVPRREFLDAHAADVRARDRIAQTLDTLLAEAPLMRFVGARLLTRSLARSAHSTATAIASEIHVPRGTLQSQILRSGGASIKRFRQELVLARLAAIVERSRLPWPIAAEILGAPRTERLLGIVRANSKLPPGLWRQRVTWEVQLRKLQHFLNANARAWSTLPNPQALARGAFGRASAAADCAKCGAEIAGPFAARADQTIVELKTEVRT